MGNFNQRSLALLAFTALLTGCSPRQEQPPPATPKSLSGKEVLSIPHTDIVFCVAFSRDDKRLAVGTKDHLVRMFDAATGREEFTLQGHEGSVYALDFSQDGARIASAGADRTVKLWDLTIRKAVFTRECRGAVHSVAFSPSAEWIVTGCISNFTVVDVTGPAAGRSAVSDSVALWNGTTGQQGLRISTPDVVFSMSLSSDGKRLVTAGGLPGTVTIWDANTGVELKKKKDFGANVAVYHPSGMLVGVAGLVGVDIWDTAADSIRPCIGSQKRVSCLVFSHDGRWLASGGEDGTIKVYDVATGDCLVTLEGHTDRVESLAFSRDGKRLASASKDKTVKVWELKE